MIPTGFKDKLPNHLSYPIGAQELTKRLQGAPYVDACRIGFRIIAVN